MLDTLIALLLLAITVTGACATISQGLRSTHRAQLATQAADLASDLIEQAHGLPPGADAAATLAQWRARVATLLPVADMQPHQFASLTPRAAEPGMPVIADLTLRWQDDPDTWRELTLPVRWPGAAVP